MNKNFIEYFGVAEFDEVLPLFAVRSKSRIPSNSKSVIVVLFPYYVGEFEKNIARYAVSNDYHVICSEILSSIAISLKQKYDYSFEYFVDASPFDEVKAGYLSGLGVIGRNGQLINPKYGSYTFIGTIVTDMYMEPSNPLIGQCIDCKECIRICPNNAVSEDKKIDKTKCRSHITQKKGELTEFECSTIKEGGMVWGCDLCTDICPHNKKPIKTNIVAFYENLEPILNNENIDEFIKTKALGYRGKAVLERNLKIIEQI